MSRRILQPSWSKQDTRRQFEYYCDFNHFTSGDMFTSIVTDGGTVSVSDAANGLLAIDTVDSTDNDEAYVHTMNELFLFANDKPFMVECLIDYDEASTDDANIFFGIMNNISANSLQDNGAGPKANFSGAVIYKVDGGTVWRCMSSLGTTQTDSVTTETAGGELQGLRIEYVPVSSTVLEVTFWLDTGNGFQQMLDNSNIPVPIKHNVTYTSATEMHVGWGVKNGDTNPETLYVDYVGWCGIR